MDIDRTELKEEMFECPICTCLMNEPVVTACGHTFCKSCILRGMDHDNKCPLCRAVIHITPEYGTCLLLKNVIRNLFPSQYLQREQELSKELREQEFQLPLFLLGELVFFPGMPLPLHVFEPRYKLMIRRCLEGGHRFGIVPLFKGKLGTIGTTALIENHWIFPDGRSLVVNTGEKRFRVKGTTEMDGYTVATVEYFHDDPFPLDVEEVTVLKAKFERTMRVMKEKMSESLKQVEEKIGQMPEGIVEFSFWAASALPITTEEKYEILSATSVGARFDLILQNLNTSSAATCIIS